jgi:hypothetical protein
VAINVLDVRDTFAPAPLRVPARPVSDSVRAADSASGRRLAPAPVLAAAVIGFVEALGLLAGALTGLDGLLASPLRPAGWVVAGGLLLLAAWVVLSAGGAATLIDGTGRRMMAAVAYAELVLVAMLFVLATATPLPFALPAGLPLPALALLAVSVPVGKLLLIGAPSALQWIAAGPRRPRERRVDPVAAHRLLCTLTLAGIGLALTALAVLVPTEAGSAADAAGVVSQR